MSQPNPRKTGAVGGCCGEVIFAIASRESTEPPSSRACASFAKSSAVEKTPACPATPPMRRALGSCTMPCSI